MDNSTSQTESPLRSVARKVLDWKDHSKAAWIGRGVLLWAVLVLLSLFPWGWSRPTENALSWVSPVLATSVIAYWMISWAVRLVRTGTDTLAESSLGVTRVRLIRLALAALAVFGALALWIPEPYGVPYVWLVVLRVPAITSVLFLLFVLPVSLIPPRAASLPEDGATA